MILAASELSITAGAFVTAAIAAIPVLWKRVEKYHADTQKQIDTCISERSILTGRVTALEVIQSGDVPRWVRNRKGVFLSVSGEFLRLFAEPVGYSEEDILGKTFEQLPNFSEELRRQLREIDLEALVHQYASRCHVSISVNVKATIIKICRSGSGSGQNVLYIGYAVPELKPERNIGE